MIYFHGVCSTSTVFSLRKVCHLCIGHTYDSTNALRDRTDWTGGAPQGATLRRQENQTVNQWGDKKSACLLMEYMWNMGMISHF